MADKRSKLDKNILAYYESREAEGERLVQGLGRLEFLRVQELVQRHLPDRPLGILDVGGAAGIHASWLAAEGHAVQLVDPVPLHIEQAAAVAGELKNQFTATLGDARELPVEDGSVDVVLLFGPLYHLIDEADRLQALSEAWRVLVPGGLLFAIGISRFASLLDGLANGMLFDPEFRKIVQRDIVDGQHRNPTGRRGWFATAFFHHPDQLESEIARAGFTVHALYGVQGMAGWLRPLAERLDDPDDLEIVLESARAVESEPSLRGLSPHMLVVAER
jgi:SAM-dependent methyltransferase